MRSFATAVLLWLFAGAAGAQCASPAMLKASLTQELYGATLPQPLPVPQAGQGGIVKTAAVAPSRVAQPAAVTGIAQPAPAARRPQAVTAVHNGPATPRSRDSAQDNDASAGRSPGSAALYAVIAVMAAIALRRRGM